MAHINVKIAELVEENNAAFGRSCLGRRYMNKGNRSLTITTGEARFAWILRESEIFKSPQDRSILELKKKKQQLQ